MECEEPLNTHRYGRSICSFCHIEGTRVVIHTHGLGVVQALKKLTLIWQQLRITEDSAANFSAKWVKVHTTKEHSVKMTKQQK